MKPSFITLKPIVSCSTRAPSSISNKPFGSRITKRVNCPFDTVPIKRTSKEDLIKAKKFMDQNLSMSNFDQNQPKPPGFHVSQLVNYVMY